MTADNDNLIDLSEAAVMLGYQVAGVRKLVDRSRAGKPGPKLRFFQTGKNAPIRFRRSWINEFIEENSRLTTPAPTPSPVKRQKTKEATVSNCSPVAPTSLTALSRQWAQQWN